MWRMWQHMNIHQSLCYEPLVPLGKHYLSIIIHKWTDMQYMTSWNSFHKKVSVFSAFMLLIFNTLQSKIVL